MSYYACSHTACRCHNRCDAWLTDASNGNLRHISWTARARSAVGRGRRWNRTIPPRDCDFWIITTRGWRHRRLFRAAISTKKCTCARPKERGYGVSKRGWRFSVSCRNLLGLAGSPAIHHFAGWALRCTDLSPGTAIAFPVRPRDARATRARSPRRGPSEARAPCCVIIYLRREFFKNIAQARSNLR